MKKLRIAHTGDLHFFAKKRHNEFKELTRKFCQKLESEQIDVVYIGGDVVDSKARLTPEQIEAVSFFFYSVSLICPIICIPGNHDLDLKQKGSLDSLTPIINNINSKHPIYYLTESGIYNLYDIDWVVWSCIDNLDPYTISTRTAEYAIGCFHGAVKGCVTDSNWELEGEVSIDLFKNVNNAFLADIHKRQYFRDDEIAYCGSWCQVNISEEVDKGFLIWEWDEKLNKYTSSFCKLENTYGFKTYEIKDLDEWKEVISTPTSNFIVRLLYTGPEENFSAIKFTELKKELKKTTPNEIVLQKRFKKKQVSRTVKQKEKEITDFFSEFYKREGYKEEQITQLKEIDNLYNKTVDNTDYQIGEYFIEEVEINNFLCYGEDNVVNFTSMPGLIGLLGENKIGKTSLIESIAFCLFNKSPKGASSLMKLINDQQPEGTKASVQVKLTINGSYWRIKRTIVPTANGGKVKLEVYEIVGGVEIPRHEESRPQTDTKVLRKLLGDEEIFLTTVLCTADNLADFAKNRNADRLDLIIKFLGISIYDQKYKLCDEELKKTGYLYEQLKEELEKLIPVNELEERKEELVAELAQAVETSTSLQEKIETHIGYNKELETKIKDLNIIGLSKSLVELKKEAETLIIEIEAKRTQLNQTIQTQSKWLKTWDNKEVIDVWKPNYNKYDSLKEEISNKKGEIKALKTQLDSELCPTCNQKWHKVDRKKTEKAILELEGEITASETEIREYNETETKYSSIQKSYLATISQIELCESKLELFETKLGAIQQQIKIVEDNKKKIEKKIKYEEKININNGIISSLQKEKQSSEANVLYIKRETDMINNNIRIYKKKVEEIKEQEEVTKGLMLYKKGMHRTGIPSLILETYIPAINSEINNQLNDLFELNVKFELNSNTLDIFFYYDEFYSDGKGKRDITQASGMEGTVINLAIRAALSKISLLPKPSLWLLDEVFVKMDATNLEQIKPYLIRLKDQYHNIIIISHQEEVKDLPEYHIRLEKVSGITSIL